MSDKEKLIRGTSRAAIGYLFIYFDFNIGNVSILPSFVGYLLFMSAITLLKDEERELTLLRTPCVILTAFHVIKWFLSWFGVSLDGLWQISDVIVCLVNLYFHFQFITNFASIAKRYQKTDETIDRGLLRYRTLQTVMLTAMLALTFFAKLLSEEFYSDVSVIPMLVYLIAGFYIMHTLFRLKRSLEENAPEDDI